jgi:hypothetical protein
LRLSARGNLTERIYRELRRKPVHGPKIANRVEVKLLSQPEISFPTIIMVQGGYSQNFLSQILKIFVTLT